MRSDASWIREGKHRQLPAGDTCPETGGSRNEFASAFARLDWSPNHGNRIWGVGLGGGDWAYGWGPQDDNDSIATIRHAAELGINWIDTAAVYGLGHSEEVVGRLLQKLPASHSAERFHQVWVDLG